MRLRNALAGLLLLFATACAGGGGSDPAVALEVETFPEIAVDVYLSETAVRQILASEIPPPEYNSNPPTSGARAGKAAACGIFRQPVPDV